MDYSSLDNVLDVYSLEQIFELNDVTEEDVLLFLVEHKYLKLPNPKSLDFD